MSDSRIGTFRSLAAASIVVAALSVPAPASAAGMSVTVCTSGCQYTSVQAALTAAGSSGTVLVGPGTYNGGIVVTTHVTIIGAGASTVLTGGHPVIDVRPGASATLFGLTINGGNSGPGAGAGGIDNAGMLTLQAVLVADNSGFDTGAGGISNTGSLKLIETTVGPNTGLVGGIDNRGTALLVQSAVTGNAANHGDGGGIFNAGSMTLNHTVVSFNLAIDGTGGGIRNLGFATLDASVVEANRISIPAPLGGGVDNTGGVLKLHGSQISGNQPDDCHSC